MCGDPIIVVSVIGIFPFNDDLSGEAEAVSVLGLRLRLSLTLYAHLPPVAPETLYDPGEPSGYFP